MISELKTQTKVIWSIEGSRLDKIDLEKIDRMDIGAIRILYTPEFLDTIIDFLGRVKSLRAQNGFDIPLMIDVGDKKQAHIPQDFVSKEFQYGQNIEIAPPNVDSDLAIYADNWSTTFVKDAHIYIGFGNVILRVLEAQENNVKAKVIHGGVVHSYSDVHIPLTRTPVTLNDLSYIDIDSFKNLDVDYVILPGLSSRELKLAKKKLADISNHPWLITKIDTKKVFEDLDGILDSADGVMISRRELALTTDPATVPMIGKDIIQRSFNKAKIVIMASEMLASMRHNPTPTRAEVSDIANAVIDGTDAIALNEEVALGSYESRALQVCHSIIEDLEHDENIEINWQRRSILIQNELDAVTYHAYKTASRIKARAIVCVTKEGNTALRLASFRIPIPIIAVTFSKKVQRRLSLVRGVSSVILDIDPNLDQVLPTVNERLKRDSWLETGDLIVFVTVTLSPVGRESSNLFTVQKLE